MSLVFVSERSMVVTTYREVPPKYRKDSRRLLNSPSRSGLPQGHPSFTGRRLIPPGCTWAALIGLLLVAPNCVRVVSEPSGTIGRDREQTETEMPARA